jgi:hypothetical protein
MSLCLDGWGGWGPGEDIYVSNAQVVDNTDGVIVGAGVPISTGEASKKRQDLVPSNAPAFARTHLQGPDGNLKMAPLFNGTTQGYVGTLSATLNVLTADHTFTFAYYITDSTAETLMLIGSYYSSGIWIYGSNPGAVDTLIAQYEKVGTGVSATAPSSRNAWHVGQVVRSGNTATTYVDGVAGTPVDVTGYGLDSHSYFSLGNYGDYANYMHGSIAFAHLQRRALSAAELKADREKIRGVLSSAGGYPGWTFSRATSRYVKTATSGMRLVPPNVPRVGGDGAILLERATTNLAPYSEVPSGNWTAGQGSWTNTTSFTLPNGDASGTHVYHEDSATSFHWVAGVPINVTGGHTYTMTVFAKPINRSMFNLSPSGSATYYANFDVANGVMFQKTVGVDSTWIESYPDGVYRVGITWLQPTDAAVAVAAYLMDVPSGYNYAGLNQDAIGFWGMTIEEKKYPSTYCGPTGAGSVTCNADVMYMAAHTAGTNQDVLPKTICPTCAAKDITIQLEVKCLWDSATEINPGSMIDINPAGDWVHNRISIEAAAGALTFLVWDNAGTLRYPLWTAGQPTVASWAQWNTLKFYVDSSDFSRMEAYINGGKVTGGYVGHSGSGTLDASNAVIYLGTRPDFAYQADCWVRKPVIKTGEF